LGYLAPRVREGIKDLRDPRETRDSEEKRVKRASLDFPGSLAPLDEK